MCNFFEALINHPIRFFYTSLFDPISACENIMNTRSANITVNVLSIKTETIHIDIVT